MINRDRLEVSNSRVDLGEAAPLEAPFVVFVDPCGACNFSCKFCPCNNSDFKAAERHERMSMELFEKILTDLEAFGDHLKVINLYGFGEPLLHKNYMEMATEIKQRGLCRELRCTTNGSLLTWEKSQALIDTGIDMVRISIEALSSEDYKRVSNVTIDFDKLVENVKTLYELSRGTNTKVSVKILNVALEDDAAATRFYDIFEPISDFSYIQDTTQAWAEFEAFIPEGNYVAGNTGGMKTDEKICSFSLTTMVIHSNGSVGVCPQDWKFATEQANVKEHSLAEIWNSKRLKSFTLAHLSGQRHKIPYCRDCDICVSNDDVVKSAPQIIERIKEQIK